MELLRNIVHCKPSKRTGLTDRMVFLTDAYLQCQALFLSKPISISRIFKCDACAQYTVIGFILMMFILGFVYLYTSVTFMLCFFLGNQNICLCFTKVYRFQKKNHEKHCKNMNKLKHRKNVYSSKNKNDIFSKAMGRNFDKYLSFAKHE